MDFAAAANQQIAGQDRSDLLWFVFALYLVSMIAGRVDRSYPVTILSFISAFTIVFLR